MARALEGALLFDLEWLDRETGTTLERATFSSLEIRAEGHVLTEVWDLAARSVRPGVRVAAYDLALWLAANWWRLRWEPWSETLSWQLSHRMSAIGGGYVWPDITFSSDGEIVSVKGVGTPPSEAEGIRYLTSAQVPVPVDAFQTAVSEFVETVIDRLLVLDADGRELRTLWEEVRRERGDPEHAEWRKLEALLGFDPDEGPEDLLNALHSLAETVGEGAMEEVASASKSDARSHLNQLWEVSRPQATGVQLPDFLRTGLVREAGPPASNAHIPWVRGEALAREARDRWGLEPGPISSGRLADLLGVSQRFVTGDGDSYEGPMPAGFRGDNGLDLSVVIGKRHPNSRHFALARLIADHLTVGPDDRILPVTSARTARQKLQRAFAQEFLCPFRELEEFVGDRSVDDELIEAAAEHFQVSPLLVTTKLVNKGRLERGVLED